jgi:Putative peptidoglycan binding domain
MFLLTDEHLQKLWDINAFPVPKDRWVFFGLRGCLPADDGDHSFANAHAVNVEAVDYVHPRCTIGQWRPGGEFALFAGSTVPHRKHVAASRTTAGAGTSQLMTGSYPDYRKGIHKAGSNTGHEAFRQDNKLPVQRSGDDLDFDTDDRVEFEQPFDNLHAAWSHGVDHESFASAGCQVVVGFPKCRQRENRSDTGPWKVFKENAYGIAQNSFFYVLLTGHDAERVAHAAAPLAPQVRYGSKGPLVTLVQEALKQRGFYEGEIDDDFGIRTLRAVLRFQTTEFGPSGDDGIVGPQTASALALDWPRGGGASLTVRGREAPAVAVARATFGFEGDHAVAPDGTRFAKRFKKGVFNFGETSIQAFIRIRPGAFTGIVPSLLKVMQAVSQNEGKLEAINTWDDSFMTFGVFQWTAGQKDERGELAALLDRLKREDPAVFQEFFGRHGLEVLDVTSGPPAKPGATPVGAFAIDGVALDSAAAKEGLRTLEWAHRFWLAGHNDTVRAVQIRQAMDRLGIFYRSPRHVINGRTVADYVSSELGVALLLDQHVNRPGHVPKTLRSAIERMGRRLPSDPSTWGDAHERDLLHEYVDLRSATNMTDSTKRAQVVFEALAEGTISDRRGSFAA